MTPVRFVLAMLLVGAGASAAHGQTSGAKRSRAAPDTIADRVETAFTEGDAQQLLSPSADRVEVSLFGTRTFYSSAQAFYVLSDFFDTHPPTNFAVGDVTEAGDSCFLRGQFSHRRDERALQVYLRFVRREGAWQLQEVRVDTDVK